ncbi:hypothetical protein DFH06DRAFT_1120632 [Mycena polygramma]|nr:hypothetical protein DFH06DRAFT_1120632 [Mycena polygramma]
MADAAYAVAVLKRYGKEKNGNSQMTNAQAKALRNKTREIDIKEEEVGMLAVSAFDGASNTLDSDHIVREILDSTLSAFPPPAAPNRTLPLSYPSPEVLWYEAKRLVLQIRSLEWGGRILLLVRVKEQVRMEISSLPRISLLAHREFPGGRHCRHGNRRQGDESEALHWLSGRALSELLDASILRFAAKILQYFLGTPFSRITWMLGCLRDVFRRFSLATTYTVVMLSASPSPLAFTGHPSPSATLIAMNLLDDCALADGYRLALKTIRCTAIRTRRRSSLVPSSSVARVSGICDKRVLTEHAASIVGYNHIKRAQPPRKLRSLARRQGRSSIDDLKIQRSGKPKRLAHFVGQSLNRAPVKDTQMFLGCMDMVKEFRESCQRIFHVPSAGRPGICESIN